ncbi:MAG: MerR family transcriptional regulator [Anaerolineae bacterium]|nr:MerR family transcriptional regulator [Anaerolineae bacterium]
MTSKNGNFTIQQTAEVTGLSVHTLRYYENIGLIHPINRADNTHRRYSQEDIDWIRFLKKLRATGMSIQDMQTYAELQRQGDVTLPERVEMLKNLQQKLESHIDELNEHLNLIRYKITFYTEIIEETLRETVR